MWIFVCGISLQVWQNVLVIVKMYFDNQIYFDGACGFLEDYFVPRAVELEVRVGMGLRKAPVLKTIKIYSKNIFFLSKLLVV